MSSLRTTLAEAAEQNHDLIIILSRTDYAGPVLKENGSYTSDLSTQIGALNKELKQLHATTEDERKDHLKYRDSTVKRYAAKMRGHKGQEKLASQQEKEEREFLEAWQKENEAKQRHEELTKALNEAEVQHEVMTKDAARHARAQESLDRLYNGIFGGPTPEYPEEDQIEGSVSRCRKSTAEKRALNALRSAHNSLGQGLNSMQEALSMSTYDMWGGGTFVDMMERDALARAQNQVTQASWHIEEARRVQPIIRPLSQVNIDMGHFISDVMFDNIFTDMAQHDRIKSSNTQLQRAFQELQAQLGDQQQRFREAESQTKQASQSLDEARVELQRVRAEAFERFGGRGGEAGPTVGDEAPPTYSAM
ncbi:hypothetical protein LTS14_006210 [Recurvomyces mirabilis]|uniref:uncharacterized protein n=1 Tax=Recurvomyces mirabilis TaxID=574656 RepID=UPI002DDE0CA7|nr:hypothetical protein LTS14_006210 [Recurvomyces mirabilis]